MKYFENLNVSYVFYCVVFSLVTVFTSRTPHQNDEKMIE